MVTRSAGRSLGEWAVLGLLAEEPAHPFALARQLQHDGALGTVFTVRRPLVYRAVERLQHDGLIERRRTEAGAAGPDRTVFEVSDQGREILDGWLQEPVDHVREFRLALLLKIVLLQRASRSICGLVGDQRSALAPTLERFARLGDRADVVDLWRHHNALAAAAFLDEVERAAEG